MTNWTVRTRIVAGFAAVASIILALGVYSYVQFTATRTAVTAVTERITGIVRATQIGAASRNVLPAMLAEAAETGEEAKVRAEATERAMTLLADAEEQFRPTTANWGPDEQALATAMFQARARLVDQYRSARANGALTTPIVHAQLEPALVRHGQLVDSLTALSRKVRDVALLQIRARTSNAERGLFAAVVAALVLAVLSASVIVRMIQKPLAGS